MDEALLEIREYQGEGYRPLIDYGAWRVAFLRYLDGLHPEQIDTMERHMETDEVFVLLNGRAVLLIGGSGPAVDRVTPQVMEVGKVYNVKRAAWHSILMTEDATLLIVENQDTGEHNTEFAPLSDDHCREVVRLASLLEES